MEFYILINNVKQGPFPLDALASKNITPNTMVWTVGFTDWKPAKQVPELSDLLACLPPEPPIANKNIIDRKSTRLNSSHPNPSRMPSSA